MIIATNMNSTNVINRGRNANISHSFTFMGQIRTYVKLLSNLTSLSWRILRLLLGKPNCL